MMMMMMMMMMTKVQQAWPGYELVAPNLHGSTFGCCIAHLPFFLYITFLASTFFVQFCTLGLAVWVVQNIAKHPAASIFVYFSTSTLGHVHNFIVGYKIRKRCNLGKLHFLPQWLKSTFFFKFFEQSSPIWGQAELFSILFKICYIIIRVS